MAVLDLRQRAGYLFFAVMLGHIVLISAQVNSASGVPVLETVTFGAFAEVQRGVSAGVSGLSGLWTTYVDLRDVRTENEALERRLADTQVQLQEFRALAHRSQGFERLLELRDRLTLRTRAAEVVGGGATPEFRSLTIDRGTSDGLRSDMSVIGSAGVVGRVVVPSARAAKVQLLIDRNAAAGALIERSRAHGVVVGQGDELLRMEYVPDMADVLVGDPVVTSGIDGIFPKGFIIGHVVTVELVGGGYKDILVRSAVDVSSLEEVLVVLPPAEGERVAGSVQ